MVDTLELEIAGILTAKANGPLGISVLAGIVVLIVLVRTIVPLLPRRKRRR